MRARLILAGTIVVGVGTLASGLDQPGRHHNPMIDLMIQQQPVFGLYAPTPPRGRGGRQGGATADAPAPPAVTQAELARQAFDYKQADFIFNGNMERNLEGVLPTFIEFVEALTGNGGIVREPFLHLSHPLVVKTQEIAPDPEDARRNIGLQLNAGASAIMFTHVKTAEETRQGIAAMRLPAHGGTRSDDVGRAPEFWGMSEADYRQKADVWPLNPNGELVNWTIVESQEGLDNVREIAAVPGVGVLWPGAGTLRGVFTTTDANGERQFDAAAWEAAIQQVLAACKEFDVACGYPANARDIEQRMAQGFSVFVMGWGDNGFQAIEAGRRAAGR